MTIETYGRGKRITVARALCATLCPKHLILLPVPTTKDGKYVFATDIPLYDTLISVDKDSVIVGWALPDEYVRVAEEKGARVLMLDGDEKFLVDNAYLTALGTLGYVLTTTEKAPSELTVGIFGYGRIGAQLLRLFLFLGAHVRVYSSSERTKMLLAECDVECEGVGACDFSGLDLLINTAPRDMTEYFPLGKTCGSFRVLELASGDNFGKTEGIERLPGLPEKMFPDSAGKLYYEAVRRFL